MQRSNGDLVFCFVYASPSSLLSPTPFCDTPSRQGSKFLEGTTVEDLQDIWSFGMSLLACVLAGRHFSLGSLAAILLELVCHVGRPTSPRALRLPCSIIYPLSPSGSRTPPDEELAEVSFGPQVTRWLVLMTPPSLASWRPTT